MMTEDRSDPTDSVRRFYEAHPYPSLEADDVFLPSGVQRSRLDVVKEQVKHALDGLEQERQRIQAELVERGGVSIKDVFPDFDA